MLFFCFVLFCLFFSGDFVLHRLYYFDGRIWTSVFCDVE